MLFYGCVLQHCLEVTTIHFLVPSRNKTKSAHTSYHLISIHLSISAAIYLWVNLVSLYLCVLYISMYLYFCILYVSMYSVIYLFFYHLCIGLHICICLLGFVCFFIYIYLSIIDLSSIFVSMFLPCIYPLSIYLWIYVFTYLSPVYTQDFMPCTLWHFVSFT